MVNDWDDGCGDHHNVWIRLHKVNGTKVYTDGTILSLSEQTCRKSMVEGKLLPDAFSFQLGFSFAMISQIHTFNRFFPI